MNKTLNKKISIILTLLIAAILAFCCMGYGVVSVFASTDYSDIYKDIATNIFSTSIK